jgi:hypothetical protein
MASNPLVSQGTLNRLRASIIWGSFPALNVTAPFLGKAGIKLALEGEATAFHPTMTGAVTSPEPYLMISLRVNLLKTQQLAAAYKAQMELLALLGDGVVRADSAAHPPYQLTNCSIQSVPELDFSGDAPDYNVVVKGYYNINSSLWNF